MPPLGEAVIHPHGVRRQGRRKGAPPLGVTQAPPHHCASGIGQIDARHRLAGRDPKRPQPCGHPGLDMPPAVITARHDGTEPEGAHPPQTEACPGAVGGKMGVEQRRETPPWPRLKEQRDVIDALCENGR